MAFPATAKRYYARAWDSDNLFSNSTREHQPFRGLVALLIAYCLFQYTIDLTEHSIEWILLRSFPAWADKICRVQDGKTTTWLHDHSGRPEYVCLAFVLLRFWPFIELEHIWILIRDYSATIVLLQAAVVTLLYVLEQSLWLSHKMRDLSGFVPSDEPHYHSQHCQFGSSTQPSNLPPSPLASPAESDGIPRPDSHCAMSEADTSKTTKEQYLRHNRLREVWRDTPRREIRQRLFEMYGSWSPRRPPPGPRPSDAPSQRSAAVAVIHSNGEMAYYQSITADQAYQSMSFEELRIAHYQEVEAQAQADAGRSLLARSLSFLANPFLSSSDSMASHDTFGSTTSRRQPLVIDGVETGGPSGHQTSDLLTESPREPPLEMKERNGSGEFRLAVSVEKGTSA